MAHRTAIWQAMRMKTPGGRVVMATIMAMGNMAKRNGLPKPPVAKVTLACANTAKVEIDANRAVAKS